MKTKYSNDEKYMLEALKQARLAAKHGDVPIGAVIVRDGIIIARGYNKREKKQNSILHAEIVAIQKACKNLINWRLKGTKMYVTIEPCPMCAGAILLSRIDEVYYGAKDPKGGALGSSFNLFEQRHLNHHPKIIGGVLETECSQLLKVFFKAKRNKINM